MLTRYALIAALVALVTAMSGLGLVLGQLNAQQARITGLHADLDIAQHRLSQAAEAAAVHRAYIDRAQQAAQAATQAENEALMEEDSNAPLPDYLRAILDRMR